MNDVRSRMRLLIFLLFTSCFFLISPVLADTHDATSDNLASETNSVSQTETTEDDVAAQQADQEKEAEKKAQEEAEERFNEQVANIQSVLEKYNSVLSNQRELKDNLNLIPIENQLKEIRGQLSNNTLEETSNLESIENEKLNVQENLKKIDSSFISLTEKTGAIKFYLEDKKPGDDLSRASEVLNSINAVLDDNSILIENAKDDIQGLLSKLNIFYDNALRNRILGEVRAIESEINTLEQIQNQGNQLLEQGIVNSSYKSNWYPFLSDKNLKQKSITLSQEIKNKKTQLSGFQIPQYIELQKEFTPGQGDSIETLKQIYETAKSKSSQLSESVTLIKIQKADIEDLVNQTSQFKKAVDANITKSQQQFFQLPDCNDIVKFKSFSQTDKKASILSEFSGIMQKKDGHYYTDPRVLHEMSFLKAKYKSNNPTPKQIEEGKTDLRRKHQELIRCYDNAIQSQNNKNTTNAIKEAKKLAELKNSFYLIDQFASKNAGFLAELKNNYGKQQHLNSMFRDQLSQLSTSYLLFARSEPRDTDIRPEDDFDFFPAYMHDFLVEKKIGSYIKRQIDAKDGFAERVFREGYNTSVFSSSAHGVLFSKEYGGTGMLQSFTIGEATRATKTGLRMEEKKQRPGYIKVDVLLGRDNTELYSSGTQQNCSNCFELLSKAVGYFESKELINYNLLDKRSPEATRLKAEALAREVIRNNVFTKRQYDKLREEYLSKRTEFNKQLYPLFKEHFGLVRSMELSENRLSTLDVRKFNLQEYLSKLKSAVNTIENEKIFDITPNMIRNFVLLSNALRTEQSNYQNRIAKKEKAIKDEENTRENIIFSTVNRKEESLDIAEMQGVLQAKVDSLVNNKVCSHIDDEASPVSRNNTDKIIKKDTILNGFSIPFIRINKIRPDVATHFYSIGVALKFKCSEIELKYDYKVDRSTTVITDNTKQEEWLIRKDDFIKACPVDSKRCLKIANYNRFKDMCNQFNEYLRKNAEYTYVEKWQPLNCNQSISYYAKGKTIYDLVSRKRFKLDLNDLSREASAGKIERMQPSGWLTPNSFEVEEVVEKIKMHKDQFPGLVNAIKGKRFWVGKYDKYNAEYVKVDQNLNTESAPIDISDLDKFIKRKEDGKHVYISIGVRTLEN